MYYFLDFALLILIYFLFLYKKWIGISKKLFVINTLMYAYIAMVLFVTIMPLTTSLIIGGTNNLFLETANFIPFRDLRLNYGGALREIILNIIMMIPFGFLYPIIRKSNIIKTAFLTFVFSISIESLQLISARWGGLAARSFDVTDLITNTFGGLLGYLIYIALHPYITKKINL